MSQSDKRLNWLRSLCISLLVVGISLRFVNLGGKVYWHDEVYTSWHLTGHSRSEVVDRMFQGKVIQAKSLQEFQKIDPKRGVGDTVLILGREDTQHPPLYYGFARVWAGLFGDSPSSIRAFSALISLLAFPCLYWLCLELFGVPSVGWVAIALHALSPYHLLYAQEAREYSLWTVMTLLSSVVLLRAIKVPKLRHWLLYAVTLIASLYTFLFSALVAFWQGVYVLTMSGLGVTKRSIGYLAATSIAVVAALPWLYFVKTYQATVQASTAWTAEPLAPLKLMALWATNFSKIFVDFDLQIENPITYLVVIPVLLLEGYALYFLWRHTQPKIWFFVFCLICSIVVTLAIPDLLFGGQRSIVQRYLFPSFLGIEIAVAYLLAHPLSMDMPKRRLIWGSVAGALIAAQIISCSVLLQADTWWNKGVSYYHPEMARIINSSDRPIVISDNFGINPGNVVSLSYLLNETTNFLLLPQVSISFTMPTISDDFSTIFLLNLPENIRQLFEQRYQSKLQNVVGDLWQMNR